MSNLLFIAPPAKLANAGVMLFAMAAFRNLSAFAAADESTLAGVLRVEFRLLGAQPGLA
jgi:hypothetical protein